GEELDNPYSMNVVDICPVGALTNADFRFKARVWDMSHTNSICIGCSRGCNIEIWVRNNEILRLTPRHNEDVNSYWMCDHGRLNTFKFVNSETRVNSPHIRKEGQLIRVSWDEAFAEAASRLRTFGKDQIAVIGSAYATCEDNYLVSKFAKNILGTGNLDFIRHIDYSFADDILRKEDLTPNSLGAELMGVKPLKNGLNVEEIIKSIKEGKIKALYLIEDDILTADPEIETYLAKLELLIVHAANFNQSTNFADIVFPAATYAEKNGTFINFQGRLQRIRPAVATIEVDRALEGMALSRLDKFGTKFDRWAQGKHFDARATWKILTSLSNAFGSRWKYKMAEDVFDEMVSSIPELKGLNYDIIGDLGVQLKLEKVNVV
ncbi:molybdopterin-dependent oxidoreductase, partial [Ignavibacterium sp.]|uniref:molybdopterin-dependent oxidoreductase n=2 Tax=Ignavibacterium TaxID=795750 RepID=UPI0025BD0AAA